MKHLKHMCREGVPLELGPPPMEASPTLTASHPAPTFCLQHPHSASSLLGPSSHLKVVALGITGAWAWGPHKVARALVPPRPKVLIPMDSVAVAWSGCERLSLATHSAENVMRTGQTPMRPLDGESDLPAGVSVPSFALAPASSPWSVLSRCHTWTMLKQPHDQEGRVAWPPIGA